MPTIQRKFPGKSAAQIYEKVDEIMERLTTKMGLKYEKDPGEKSGKVSKMGIHGQYRATDGQVVVDLHFPMLVPGAMKKEVQATIERKLDGLFV